MFLPRSESHTPHAYFLACRHRQREVAQYSTDLHELWLEHLDRQSLSRQPASWQVVRKDRLPRLTKDVMIASRCASCALSYQPTAQPHHQNRVVPSAVSAIELWMTRPMQTLFVSGTLHHACPKADYSTDVAVASTRSFSIQKFGSTHWVTPRRQGYRNRVGAQNRAAFPCNLTVLVMMQNLLGVSRSFMRD